MRHAVLLSCLALVAGAGQAHALSRENVLHSFAGDDGAYPQTGLVADRQGNLYGTTPQGGNDNAGFVFAIDTQGAFTIIHDFQGAPDDGSGPTDSLAIDKDGNLYGTTGGGGLHGDASHGGIVFQLRPAGGGTWTETVLYNFCSRKKCADGDSPAAPPALAKDGTLYGTTLSGGTGAATADRGTVFRLAPQSGGAWKQTVLHDFCNQPDCTDGAAPFAARLLPTKSGLLYGTTAWDNGTLYSLAIDGSGYQVLHDFGVTKSDGKKPFSGVIAGPGGVLYGMTPTGGASGFGSAYSYDPSTQTYETIHSFCVQTDDACFPEGALMLVDDEKGPRFYGTSNSGGEGGAGTIFKLAPATGSGAHWKEKPIYSFCTQTGCDDGYSPAGALLRYRGAFYGTTTHGGADDLGVVFRFGWER